MTSEQSVMIPVTCPECRNEVMTTLNGRAVSGLLMGRRPLRLYAKCHDVYWDAHYSEIDRVRKYMDALSQPHPADTRGSAEAALP